MSRSRSLIVLNLFLALVPTAAHADLEEVLVTSTTETRALVQRGNGDVWRLELGSDCPVVAGISQQRAFLFGDRGFVGADLRLLLPVHGIACRVWKVDTLRRVRPAAPPEPPLLGLRAMRESLERLGYDCGPLDQSGWLPQTATAFQQYRESRRLGGGNYEVRRAVTALALDAMKGGGAGLRLAQRLTDDGDAIARWLQSASESCGEAAWVRSVSEDGARIQLSDRTEWLVSDAGSKAMSARWQAGDEVRTCTGRAVNARTGDMVAGRREGSPVPR